MNIQKDFYEILQIDSSATNEKIKKAYQDLAKKYHPDKQGSEEKFHQIDKAYKTLKDFELRKIYDSARMQNQEHLIIHEVVSRREFDYREEDNTYTHRCKCGSNYTLDIDEFNDKDEIILSCEECSLNIRVT